MTEQVRREPELDREDRIKEELYVDFEPQCELLG